MTFPGKESFTTESVVGGVFLTFTFSGLVPSVYCAIKSLCSRSSFLRKLPNSGEKGDLLKRSKSTVWPMAQFRKLDVPCHYLSYPKHLASCVHWGPRRNFGMSGWTI